MAVSTINLIDEVLFDEVLQTVIIRDFQVIGRYCSLNHHTRKLAQQFIKTMVSLRPDDPVSAFHYRTLINNHRWFTGHTGFDLIYLSLDQTQDSRSLPCSYFGCPSCCRPVFSNSDLITVPNLLTFDGLRFLTNAQLNSIFIRLYNNEKLRKTLWLVLEERMTNLTFFLVISWLIRVHNLIPPEDVIMTPTKHTQSVEQELATDEMNESFEKTLKSVMEIVSSMETEASAMVSSAESKQSSSSEPQQPSTESQQPLTEPNGVIQLEVPKERPTIELDLAIDGLVHFRRHRFHLGNRMKKFIAKMKINTENVERFEERMSRSVEFVERLNKLPSGTSFQQTDFRPLDGANLPLIIPCDPYGCPKRITTKTDRTSKMTIIEIVTEDKRYLYHPSGFEPLYDHLTVINIIESLISEPRLFVPTPFRCSRDSGFINLPSELKPLNKKLTPEYNESVISLYVLNLMFGVDCTQLLLEENHHRVLPINFSSLFSCELVKSDYIDWSLLEEQVYAGCIIIRHHYFLVRSLVAAPLRTKVDDRFQIDLSDELFIKRLKRIVHPPFYKRILK